MGRDIQISKRKTFLLSKVRIRFSYHLLGVYSTIALPNKDDVKQAADRKIEAVTRVA